MRDSFVSALHRATNENQKIVCLAGDIGYKVFDKYRKEHPHAFINTGIAEANMVGMASGLSTCGFLPVVYTIIPFLTMRAFEQIRVDLAMHNRNVILVGVGGGYSYDYLGPTHHALEDLAIMSSLPNLEVYVPRDPDSVKVLLKYAFSRYGPNYIRLGKNKEPSISGTKHFLKDKDLRYGEVVKKGKDVVIIGRGPVLSRAVAAAKLLLKQGIDCAILDLPCVSIDEESLVKFLVQFTTVIVIDEAYASGGLGHLIANVIAKKRLSPKFTSLNVEHKFNFDVNNRDQLLNNSGLSVENIITAVQSS